MTVRFYVPQSASEDVNEKDDTAAHRLQKQILERAVLVNNNGNMIAEIDDRLGQFVTPRGRYMMEFYDNYMRMNGNNYTYKILYACSSALSADTKRFRASTCSSSPISRTARSSSASRVLCARDSRPTRTSSSTRPSSATRSL